MHTIPMTPGTGTPGFTNATVSTNVSGVNGLTATVSGTTITIHGAPDAVVNSITVSVTDSTGAKAVRSYPVTVHPASPRDFHVDTTADTHSQAPHYATDSNGKISLRSAVEAADSDASGNDPQTDTIYLPAGDYVIGAR